MRTYRRQGMSFRQIADVFGTDEHTIFRHARSVVVQKAPEPGDTTEQVENEVASAVEKTSQTQVTLQVPVVISSKWLLLLRSEATGRGFSNIDDYLQFLSERVRQADAKTYEPLEPLETEVSKPKPKTLGELQQDVRAAYLEGRALAAFQKGLTGEDEKPKALPDTRTQRDSEQREQTIRFVERGIQMGLNPEQIQSALADYNLLKILKSRASGYIG